MLCLTKERNEILQSQTSSLRCAAQGGEYSGISEKGWFDSKSYLLLLLLLLLFFVFCTAAWFDQLGERLSAERKIAGSNPGRTNTQAL